MALNYLLSLKPNLEAKDIRGLTPLHISVSSVEKIGSTRSVKTLLLRGANRETKDKDGKTPMDWITETNNEWITDELQKHLAKPSYCECLLLRVPLIPLQRNHKTQALFVFLFFTVYALNLFIIQPTLEDFGYTILLMSSISFGAVLLSFVYASAKDPGIVKPNPKLSFLELLRDVNPADLCPEC